MSAKRNKIPKKIASPPAANLNQLILDQEKLERMNQMDFRGFGSSTLNSSKQNGHETKSPTASTSSLDLQRGQRIFTTQSSNLVEIHARDFLRAPMLALSPGYGLTLSKEIHWNEKVLLTATGVPVSSTYE